MSFSNSEKIFLKSTILFVILLLVSLPIAFATELNLIYDGNGNLVSGDGYCRSYNELNQLDAVYEGDACTGNPIEKYTWHPMEEKIILRERYDSDSSWIEDIYYFDENYVFFVNESGNYSQVYIWQDGKLVAFTTPEGEKRYVLGDHLGSASVVLDEDGNVVEETFYSPFGEILTGGTASRFDYEGKEYDERIGEYDFNFRKYKPEWGRFTQPDSLIPDVYNPQALNRYSFELNNPLKNVDEDGHAVDPGSLYLYLMAVGVALLTIIAAIDYFTSEPDTTELSAWGAQNAAGPAMTTVSQFGSKLFTTVTVPLEFGIGTIDVGFTLIDDLEEFIEKDKEITEAYSECKDCKKVFVFDNQGNLISTAIVDGEGNLIYSSSSGGGKNKIVWFINPETGNPTWRPKDHEDIPDDNYDSEEELEEEED